MADASQAFTDMFRKMGEQLKVPSFDMTKIMEHHQKNFEAMTRSWQAMAGGATAIANTRDIAELVQKSSTEAFKIVQDRMKESYDEIKASVEKKP